MICLDTAPLIWGVQETATEGQEEMVEKTKRFITSLSSDNEQLMVPTPVVAEYLEGFATAEERSKQLAALKTNFFIPAFDLPSAALAAELARQPESKETKVEGVSRQEMKMDYTILATAIIHGAEKIITHDTNHFEPIAAGRIAVQGVPEVHLSRRIPGIGDD